MQKCKSAKLLIFTLNRYCIVHKCHIVQSAYNIFQEWTNIIGCICGKFIFYFFYILKALYTCARRGMMSHFCHNWILDKRISVRLCAHHTCATVALLPPWTGVTIFHTNCSNVRLVCIYRSEMSYPKISKCPQLISLHRQQFLSLKISDNNEKGN